MKSNRKAKPIILIILGILFAFLPIFSNNLRFTAEDRGITSNYNDDFLKISAVSGTIHIDGNSGWAAFRSAGNCTGSGTYFDPYVIEDLIIDGGGSGNCIWIENSNVYFRIENCIAYNSGDHPNAEIRLTNVTNAQLIDNNCSNGVSYGIYLFDCYNNTISGNTANDNVYGIYLRSCDYNTISGNTANNNDFGIHLRDCDNNTISGNNANDNQDGRYLISLDYCNNNTISGNTANSSLVGIHLRYSNNNTISGNTVNYNSYGIYLYESNNNIISGNILLGNFYCITDNNGEGNILENNNCGEDDEIIPGYNLFFLLGILSVVVIIISKKIKKS